MHLFYAATRRLICRDSGLLMRCFHVTMTMIDYSLTELAMRAPRHNGRMDHASRPVSHIVKRQNRWLGHCRLSQIPLEWRLLRQMSFSIDKTLTQYQHVMDGRMDWWTDGSRRNAISLSGLYTSHCTSIRSRFFAHRAIKAWNSLPQSTNFSSLAAFICKVGKIPKTRCPNIFNKSSASAGIADRGQAKLLIVRKFCGSNASATPNHRGRPPILWDSSGYISRPNAK